MIVEGRLLDRPPWGNLPDHKVDTKGIEEQATVGKLEALYVNNLKSKCTEKLLQNQAALTLLQGR